VKIAENLIISTIYTVHHVEKAYAPLAVNAKPNILEIILTVHIVELLA
jgi:hypothetical protein